MSNEVKIGTYDGNGSSVNISLGFMPEWFMAKRTDGIEDAFMGSGFASTGAAQLIRGAAASMVRIESKGYTRVSLRAEDGGFAGLIARSSVAVSGKTYVYMASRNVAGG